MTYGLKVDKYGDEPRSVIGEVSTSHAGNIVLRVGREHNRPVYGMDEPGGWEQTEHVVLTRDEAESLRAALATALNTQPGKTRVI